METEKYNLADSIIIKSFLENNNLGTLATLSENSEINLATLFFMAGEDYSLYFVTKTATRKFNNIINNPKSTILIVDGEELVSVESVGRTEVITDSNVVIDVITKFQSVVLDTRIGYWIPPVSQLDGGQFAVCRHTPSNIEYRRFLGGDNALQSPHSISINFDQKNNLKL